MFKELCPYRDGAAAFSPPFKPAAAGCTDTRQAQRSSQDPFEHSRLETAAWDGTTPVASAGPRRQRQHSWLQAAAVDILQREGKQQQIAFDTLQMAEQGKAQLGTRLEAADKCTAETAEVVNSLHSQLALDASSPLEELRHAAVASVS